MTTMPAGELGIEIKFERGSGDPARVFRSMTALIGAFEAIDRTLVKSIDTKIEPVLLLEDVEASSIKSWFRNVLIAVPDDALKNLDWKRAVGEFAVKAKYLYIDFTSRTTTISNREELLGLQGKILDLARETDVLRLPAYEPVKPEQIAASLDQISKALQPLRDGDSAMYLSKFGDAPFNLTFGVAPETLEELLVRDTRTGMHP